MYFTWFTGFIDLNLNQIVPIAIITLITSLDSTGAATALERYFPNELDHVERKVNINGGNNNGR
jgi:xanthine/uracil permease